MIPRLPQKLVDAEEQILLSLTNCFNNNSCNLISVNVLFEGLRLQPVALRLSDKLASLNFKYNLVWPDAGAAALAKRDAPEISQYIKTYKELITTGSLELEELVIIAVSPQPYDYDLFVNLCSKVNGKIIMLNGKLDDSNVGIGSVARERRKLFTSKWLNTYWLEPLTRGALIHLYPSDWILYKSTLQGYIQIDAFKEKPNSEQIFEGFMK